MIFHQLARSELYEVWAWYEDNQPGLGDKFVLAIDSVIDQVLFFPHSGSPTSEIHGEVTERRIGTSGFPYLVRYRVDGEAVIITAIYHEKRHPGFGAERTF